MPRRNQRYRRTAHPGRRRVERDLDQVVEVLDCDALARDLVRRRLASHAILGPVTSRRAAA